MPPLPVSPLTEVDISLLTRKRKSRSLRVMLPPLAVDVSASVEIAAPLFIKRRAAERVIDPASPLPVERAVICGPRSGSTISEATVTLTSPPLPGPAVELAICAPPPMVRTLAATVTEPPGPDCGPVAEAAIWVLVTPAPSSASAPGVVTLTEPPAPVPAVVLAISAPEVIVICGALTATDPASPRAAEVAEAMIPLPGSVKLSSPPAVT